MVNNEPQLHSYKANILQYFYQLQSHEEELDWTDMHSPIHICMLYFQGTQKVKMILEKYFYSSSPVLQT